MGDVDYQTTAGRGYAFTTTDGNGSTACLAPTQLCAKGVAAQTSPTTYSTVWGVTVGLNVNGATGAASAGTLTLPGSGISYALSSLPAVGTGGAVRIDVDHNGVEYCAAITAASGTLPWSHFTAQCWTGTGAALTGPPTATYVNVAVASATSGPEPFDFCITSLTL